MIKEVFNISNLDTMNKSNYLSNNAAKYDGLIKR